jgi:hypothetical protein
MLEILFLIWFRKKLSGIAQEKGRSGGWGALALLWIVGEIAGFVVAAMLGTGDDVMSMYPLALVGAIAGAVTAWLIVRSLSGHTMEEPVMAGVPIENRHYDPSNPFSPPRAS